MKTSNEEKTLTKKDLRKIAWRSLPLEASWHYERQQHLGFCYSLQSALKKIYKGQPEKYIEALKRHTGEFFNTAPQAQPFISGLVCAMEEENAAVDDFDVSTISAIKVALMGPCAGIFDAIFLSTVRIIGTAVGTSFCMQGNPLGVVIFLLVYNVPAFICRFLGVGLGYHTGAQFITNLEASGMLGKFKDAAALVAMMAFGWMTKNYVGLTLGYAFGPEGAEMTVQGVLDSIIPGLTSLGLVWLFWYLLTKKKVNVMAALTLTVIFAIAGTYLGIFG